MNVVLTRFSRSMSTPLNPYCFIRENTLPAKLLALVASLTEIVPFLPADGQDDLLPARLRGS